jgi:signal peptidase II
MKTNPFLRAILIILILAATVALDQYSKKVVREKIGEYQAFSYLHNHFVIEKVENTGAFLSLGDSSSKPMRIIFLDAIPLLLIVGALGYILIKTNINRVTLLAIIFMIGGGIGNIYDRIAHGSVTDFLYINLGGIFHTGVFNVADLFITIGISIVLVQSWFGKKTVEVPADEPIN